MNSHSWSFFNLYFCGFEISDAVLSGTMIAEGVDMNILSIARMAVLGMTLVAVGSAQSVGDKIKDAGTDTKNAAKKTGSATKDVAKDGVDKTKEGYDKTKDGVKKGTHAAAKGTKKAADKVADKTQ
jgi:hypothetical protein